MQHRQISINDIAEATGFSITTVSCALSGKGRVKAESRKKIIETAQEMGYQVNMVASALSTKVPLKIGVICPDHDIYFSSVLKGIDAYFEEIWQYKVKLFYYLHDGYASDSQLEMLRRCEEEKMDGILISPIDDQRIAEFMRDLRQRNIPVIAFTNDLYQSSRLCYVGSNACASGNMAGHLMEKILPPGSRVSLLSSCEKLNELRLRMQCFKNIMEQSENNYIVGPEHFFQNNPENAAETVCSILREEHPDAIYTNNMLGTVAIGRAIRDYAPGTKIVTFGYDLNDEIGDYLADGILDLILFQDPFSQGYFSLMLLFRFLSTKQPLKLDIYYIRTLIVTKDNYKEQDSMHTVLLG